MAFYKARGKGVAARLAELGYPGMNGGAYTQQAVSAWKTKGTGLATERFLALARDLQLDLNALVYGGRVATYDPAPDYEAQRLKLVDALAAMARLLAEE